MVQEKLAVHQEEWEIVSGPCHKEVTTAVPQPVADRIRDELFATSPTDEVADDHADIDEDTGRGRPPANHVANKVNLLLGVVLRPEGDAGEEVRPRNWIRSVRVRRSQAGIVLKHENLELAPLAEEVERLDLLLRLCFGTVADVVAL